LASPERVRCYAEREPRDRWREFEASRRATEMRTETHLPTRLLGHPAHPVYIVYLVAIVDLALKARWSLKGTVLVMLSGAVPVGSFFAERAVSRRGRAGEAL
jgi:integral membrane protein